VAVVVAEVETRAFGEGEEVEAGGGDVLAERTRGEEEGGVFGGGFG